MRVKQRDMTVRKWRLVEGRVYKLSKVFDNCVNALHHARILNREHHAILVKTSEHEWAIYWRARDEIQCESKHSEIESTPTKIHHS